nr:hypothetical protein [Armatimonadota bacterium]
MAVKPKKQSPASDYDTAWKEAIVRYFPLFLLFFYFDIHEEIDWSRPYEFMDKELHGVKLGGKSRRKIVDMLVKVWLKTGQEIWVLIHIEVQNQFQNEFPKRMFVYAYRIYDRYGHPIASLAVLGDNDPNWRPEGYGYNVFGTGMQHQYRVAKLTDYEEKLEELE